jgi:hypothetical protein
MEKEINGWKYYRNQTHGKMVAYYPNTEQLIFETDEAFNKWLEAEKNEGHNGAITQKEKRVSIIKWNRHNEENEIYDIYYVFIHIGSFINENRDKYNSVLRLHDEYFSADMLTDVAEAIKEKFGDKQFKILSK